MSKIAKNKKSSKKSKSARISKSARNSKSVMLQIQKSTVLQIPMPKTAKMPEQCCAVFDPSRWDGKELVFDHKWFAKDHVTSFMHMPLNFGSVVVRMMKAAKATDAKTDEMLLLCEEKSLFGADIYLAVKKNTPGLACGTISGKFLTKAFEGPYSSMDKWIGEMKAYVNGKGKGVMRMLFFYPQCPKCAKKAGKNYIVIFAQVE